jgi:pSer/pThr/pTyr-binding forkhead associated (FHA) protein
VSVRGFGIVCSHCRRLNAEKSATCENCQKPLADAKSSAVGAARPLNTTPRPIGTPPKPLATAKPITPFTRPVTPSTKPSEIKPAEAKPAGVKPTPISKPVASTTKPLGSKQALAAVPETVKLQEPSAQSKTQESPKIVGNFDDDLIGDWIQRKGIAENKLSDATPSFLEAFQDVTNDPQTTNKQLFTEPPMERRDQIICTNCGAVIHPGHKFCGKCGTSLEEIAAKRPPTDLFGPLQQVGKAKLVLIKGEGLDGISYQLNAREHSAGRNSGAIQFPDDPFLSPRHANFYYREGRLFIRDDGGLNGIYLRLREPVPLTSGDFFLCGEEIFRFEVVETDDDVVAADGTYFFSSPKRRNYFRLVQILVGGREGLRYHAKRKSLIIGRERCDLNFPLDRFISGSHSKVEMTDTGCKLSDMGSRNGTFIRIHNETELTHGDYVFLGQQLLRVEITER